MEHVERNQAWADLLSAESRKVWVGFEADRRDGAVTPNDDQGDQPVTRAADPVLRLIMSREKDQLPATYLDDLEAQRAAVRAQRDQTA